MEKFIFFENFLTMDDNHNFADFGHKCDTVDRESEIMLSLSMHVRHVQGLAIIKLVNTFMDGGGKLSHARPDTY